MELIRYPKSVLVGFFILLNIQWIYGQRNEEMSPTIVPKEIMPIPTTNQLKWQQMELYAFIHFNMNTFTNMEWGFGDEDPALFNPSELDCRQWARVCKEAGMKGIILTAKHHDGFCLWPSRYTEHSVKNAPWKDGKGDVVRDLANACKEFDLKMGIYLSPWDRNHPDYGKPVYIDYFRNQLRELLTNYGEVFEVWFDGANGGTGYYGGANEERRVDKRTYYDWKNTYSIIRELQPKAVIFSDAGPDVRWVGNEHGFAYPTTWSNLMRDSIYGGMPEYSKKYAAGQENGTHWVPAEADVSIRPGWYYHPYEDHKVKSLPELLDIYYHSVGRNSTLLLNFPVDTRGLIHENDVTQLQKLTAKIKEDFATNLAKTCKISASSARKGSKFQADRVIDDDIESYWTTKNDRAINGSLTFTFPQPTTFNRLLLQEYIAKGQRIKAFSVEIKTGNGWEKIASETTIGYKRILRLAEVRTTSIRINIKDAKACPLISNIEIYHAPKLLVPPQIKRNKQGVVSLEVPEPGVRVHYTTDGSIPSLKSSVYNEPFLLSGPGMIQAFAVDGSRKSEISKRAFDLAPIKWTVMDQNIGAEGIIDGNEKTWWTLPKEQNEVVIDLGEKVPLKGFTYLPMQARWISGIIKEYAFYASKNNRTWKKIAEGEFANILNSPVWQRIQFPATKARYIKLKALRTIDEDPATFSEIGILTH